MYFNKGYYNEKAYNAIFRAELQKKSIPLAEANMKTMDAEILSDLKGIEFQHNI